MVGVGLDVRSQVSFEAAIAATTSRYGGLDVLVNNAAVTVRRPLFEIDAAEWDEVMAVNLRSVFLGCRLAGPHMRARGWGRIINISSLAGQQGSVVNGAHYAASKAGILAFTKVVARELAPDGVTVNAVAPAAIDGAVMAEVPADQAEALRRSIPVGRLGSADEVAALVGFLASDAAAVHHRRHLRRQRRAVHALSGPRPPPTGAATGVEWGRRAPAAGPGSTETGGAAHVRLPRPRPAPAGGGRVRPRLRRRCGSSSPRCGPGSGTPPHRQRPAPRSSPYSPG